MSENVTRPKYLSPWICPKCSADCSANADQCKDLGDATGYLLQCACGCEFIHWENVVNMPYGVEVDGETYEYPQEVNEADVSLYVSEYEYLAGKSDDQIVRLLNKDHDWTPGSGEVLLELAQKYGSFALRSALALALALDIEDGSEGL